ncbi:hypothetical protein KHM83_01500 [Fusibacter paucivorans]|uniref:BhlA holin family protein n=1 Tax=Fusibacter paucivorans TaxID=76009 RepID=A0ABS5PL90_9FIRM|nr:hypothetical protein [Fusibacter paucivorans]MBS7525346.1 hypothetical protein [Fusibacter paucivorans]
MLRIGSVAIEWTFLLQLFNTALVIGVAIFIYRIGRKYLKNQTMARQLKDTEQALRVSQDALHTCETALEKMKSGVR